MVEPFKNFFNVDVIEKMGSALQKADPSFEMTKFLKLAKANLEDLELKERSNQIKDALKATMSNDISVAGPILCAILGEESPIDGGTTSERTLGIGGFAIMPMADFVADIGIDELDVSFDTLEELTKRFSAEFAVRPFLVAHPQEAMKRFTIWAKSENAHVRRLASEGCRPLLPWGIRLHQFVDDPSPILPILEQLKSDPTEYVRRSVANNINDIAKNQPELVAQIAEKWMSGADRNRERMVRHACRTLIKQGHPPTLRALGYGPLAADLKHFNILSPELKLGEGLEFSFAIQSSLKVSQPYIIDFAIHFVKANGSLSPKVFKLKSGTLKAGEILDIEKRQVIKKITTRTFYPGEHKLEILINGQSYGLLPFNLEV